MWFKLKLPENGMQSRARKKKTHMCGTTCSSDLRNLYSPEKLCWMKNSSWPSNVKTTPKSSSKWYATWSTYHMTTFPSQQSNVLKKCPRFDTSLPEPSSRSRKWTLQSANATKSDWNQTHSPGSGTVSVKQTDPRLQLHQEEDLFNLKHWMSHNLIWI